MMHPDAHVLLAYGFDGKGGAIPLAEQDISKQIKARNLTWVHFDAADPRTREWLHQEISYLDPFIIEALLADETRPRVTEVGDGAIIILRSVNLDAHADPEDMVSIRLWIDSHRIISVQLRTLKVVMDLADCLKSGHGPHSAGDFISMLIDKMFDGMEPALSTLDERIDEMEEEVLTPAPPEALREEIASIRRQAIIFRRYMAPQREAVAQLKNSDLRWLDGLHKRQLQESYDHITRFVENLDAVRERAQIIKDELAANMSNRISRNMYSISVMTAVFLPLTFITGLLGINVGGIPGAENSIAFYIICLILALLVAAQITVFKKFKWF